MARKKFKVEVLTPEGEVFNEEVEMLSTRTESGSIGVLAGHQPLLAAVAPAELRLYRSESDTVTFAQGEGYLQVAPEGVLVLVEEASDPNSLDSEQLKAKLQQVETELAAAESGSEHQLRLLRDKRRWQAFAAIAEAS